MRCPKCGGRLRVYAASDLITEQRRWRQCTSCDFKFVTVERFERDILTKKRVVKVAFDGTILETYQSVKDAAKANHFTPEAIRARCNGEIKKPFKYGFSFRFYEEDKI